MDDYFNLSITRRFNLTFGAHGFHGYAFGRGVHLNTGARLAGERRVWFRRDADVVTGRIGPFSFTTDKQRTD